MEGGDSWLSELTLAQLASASLIMSDAQGCSETLLLYKCGGGSKLISLLCPTGEGENKNVAQVCGLSSHSRCSLLCPLVMGSTLGLKLWRKKSPLLTFVISVLSAGTVAGRAGKD